CKRDLSPTSVFKQTRCRSLHNQHMQFDTIGEVIATRQLNIMAEPDREVLVKIGRPEPSEHHDYCCRIQVTGIGDERIDGIYGVDAVQALELAMRFLGSELQRLNTQHQGRLRWGDAPKGWFGFPIDKKLDD